MQRRGRLLLGAGLIIPMALSAGLLGNTRAVVAACSGTCATNTVTLGVGGLSISGMTGTTFASASVGAGTLSSTSGVGMDPATWSDTTGSGAGWHGTIATTLFNANGTWSQTGGTTTALGALTSGTYTGTAANALITVTVSSGGTTTNTPFTWTDTSGSPSSGTVSTCSNNTACGVDNGVTITFAAATTYPAGAAYQVHSGNFPASAMKLSKADAGTVAGVGTTGLGSNMPGYENDATTVSGSTPTTVGTAVSFVTAQVNSGEGAFTLAPGVTITWDPNNTWSSTTASNYTATAQYTIVSGP